MNDAMSINVDGSPSLMGRVGQKLCAAKERANKAVCLLDARMRLLTAEPEKGAVTAEYAVVLVAATAFAAVLIAIVKSDVVKTLLTGLIKKALSVGQPCLRDGGDAMPVTPIAEPSPPNSRWCFPAWPRWRFWCCVWGVPP